MLLLVAFVSVVLVYGLNVIAGMYGLLRLFQIVTNYEEVPGFGSFVDFLCRGVLFLICVLLIDSIPFHTNGQETLWFLISNFHVVLIKLGGVTMLLMSLMANVGQSIYYLCIKEDLDSCV